VCRYGLKLSATNQAYRSDAGRLTVGIGFAFSEADGPCPDRIRDERRIRPEKKQRRIGKIGQGNARTRGAGMDQSEKLAPRRQAPVGEGAESGVVYCRCECLGVAQVAGQGRVACVAACAAGITAVGAAVAV